MNWRTAHRNRRRAQKSKPAPIQPSWREWLERVLPYLKQNLIREDSVFAQFWKNAEILGTRRFNPMTLPRFDSIAHQIAEGHSNTVEYRTLFGGPPNRTAAIWRQVLAKQEGKCAQCGVELELQDSMKKCRSFEIICQACYAKSPAMFIVIDDLDGMPLEDVINEPS